ncbi:MAG: hypothetical protein PHV20_14070 [Bacteroidales bacterium]|nr:hypothetical protein [Bacteroidales bacterium]
MKKYCIIFFLSFNLYHISCQSIVDDLKFYVLGMNYLQKNDFLKADSLLTKYINSGSVFRIFKSYVGGYNDAFYNRAIAKLGLKDTISACSDFHNASLLDDNEAFQYYCSYCINSIDSIFFDKKYKAATKNKAKYLKITYIDKYKNQFSGMIVDISKKGRSKTWVDFGNLVGTFYINDQDTIYSIYTIYNMPRFNKSSKTLNNFIDSKLIYPEDKSIAYNLYNMDAIKIYYKVIIDKYGKIETINLDQAIPENIEKKYMAEAMRVIKETSGYFLPGKILGQEVKTELIIPVTFILK